MMTMHMTRCLPRPRRQVCAEGARQCRASGIRSLWLGERPAAVLLLCAAGIGVSRERYARGLQTRAYLDDVALCVLMP